MVEVDLHTLNLGPSLEMSPRLKELAKAVEWQCSGKGYATEDYDDDNNDE